MGTYILTSMFPHGIPSDVAEIFRRTLTRRSRFAFIASEFERGYEKTDRYFHLFLQMLADVGISFEETFVVDGRMTSAQAQKILTEADVVWLSGGDTPVEFDYWQKYGLVEPLRRHDGVIIGMSAGSINLAETAICSLTCGHYKQEIYPALGCVKISVEPHFIPEPVSDELLELSKQYPLYGLCDNSIVLCDEGKLHFCGEVYFVSEGGIRRIS